MNILFCYSNWMNPVRGGVQRVSDTLAKYFICRGHKISYLTLQYFEKDTYNFPGKIYHLPDPDFFSDINLAYYQNLLYEVSIDIVINHDAANNHSKLFLNSGNHPAKKISLYHTDPLYGINKAINVSGRINNFIKIKFAGAIRFLKVQRKKMEIGQLLKKSDRLVLLSDEFHKQIIKELKIKSSKIVSINNPCVSYLEQSIIPKKKQLLFVARIDIAVKRHDKMLQIWSYIHNKFPDWELIFLGDGPDRVKVEEMAIEMGLKNVRFEGFVDPLSYYKSASILCMTSEYEGFPSVLLEAMQFGLTTIMFNNWASISDVITDYETGILIKTDNTADYIGKLDHLLSNEILRDRISSNAIEYVKKFRIETIGPKWMSLFDDLLREKN